MDLNQARFNMIEQQIRPWQVGQPQILALLQTVHREDFVPPEAQNLAFVDMELPVGRAPGQTMLAPRVQARMVQELALKPTDRVLQIGCGTGFVTALLAHQAASVLAFEIDADLAGQARTHLLHAGLAHAQVRHADGSAGAPEDGPFDAIVLCGSVAQVPQTLLDQLAPGGRLVAIVGHAPMMRVQLICATAPGQLQRSEPWDTVAPRLIGFAPTSAFQF